MLLSSSSSRWPFIIFPSVSPHKFKSMISMIIKRITVNITSALTLSLTSIRLNFLLFQLQSRLLFSLISFCRRFALLNYTCFALNQFFWYFPEKKMNVVSIFSGYFNIRISVLLCILLQFLLRYLSFSDIRFVSNQEDHCVLAKWLSDEIEPTINSL